MNELSVSKIDSVIKKNSVYRKHTGQYYYIMQFGFNGDTGERVVICGNLENASDIRADSYAEFLGNFKEVSVVPDAMLASLQKFQKAYGSY